MGLELSCRLLEGQQDLVAEPGVERFSSIVG